MHLHKRFHIHSDGQGTFTINLWSFDIGFDISSEILNPSINTTNFCFSQSYPNPSDDSSTNSHDRIWLL